MTHLHLFHHVYKACLHERPIGLVNLLDKSAVNFRETRGHHKCNTWEIYRICMVVRLGLKNLNSDSFSTVKPTA